MTGAFTSEGNTETYQNVRPITPSRPSGRAVRNNHPLFWSNVPHSQSIVQVIHMKGVTCYGYTYANDDH